MNGNFPGWKRLDKAPSQLRPCGNVPRVHLATMLLTEPV